MIKIETSPIPREDFSTLIAFDDKYLRSVIMDMGADVNQLPPLLTSNELESALEKKDILQWIFVNKNLVGYFYLEFRNDHIFISGIALKENVFGMGVCQHIMHLAEVEAAKRSFTRGKLAVLPVNGRAISAYLKQGYKITSYVNAFFGPDYPDSFRLIMEKNLLQCEKMHSCNGYAVACASNKELKDAIDNGYIGIRLMRSDNNLDVMNKIWFEKK